MIDDIKTAEHGAAASKRKVAMFHLQTLKHADEFEGVDPEGSCKELSVGMFLFSASHRTDKY